MPGIWTTVTAVNFGIQFLGFAVANSLKTEKFYDVTGSVSYLTVLAIIAGKKKTLSFSQKIQIGLAGIWTVRLGSYLLVRILKEGEDKRFREIKQSPMRFFIAWTLQGVWVMITLFPTLKMVINQRIKPISAINLLGWSVFALGFACEAIADQQKWNFRMNNENAGKFIKSGLWSISRHPNYLGEIVLWSGMCLSSFSYITATKTRLLACLSPMFIAFLLIKVSGIPMLEQSADKRWGHTPEYQLYKANTPVLIPYIY